MDVKALHIVVRGRVQGVCYRACAKTRASELKLTGWVRNCPDGTVAIHVEGDREKLERFVQWCRKGPPAADVTGLEATPATAEGMNIFLVR